VLGRTQTSNAPHLYLVATRLALMTELWTVRSEFVLRLRSGLLALACVTLLAVALLFANPFYLIIAIGLALDLSITLALRLWRNPFTPRQTLYLFLSMDLLVTALAIFCVGGIQSGLVVAYTFTPFMALLLLGRKGALWFALGSGGLLACQIFLDWNGIRVPQDALPFLPSLVEQSFVSLVFLAIILIFTSLALDTTRQLAQDKRTAETQRAQAEQAQTRWTLINNVALHVQESTTPDQVFATVGNELERNNLHCAVWEWTKPTVSMRMAFVSLPAQTLKESLEFFQLDLATFDMLLTQTMGLAESVTRRTPVLLSDSFATMSRSFPQIPPATLRRALTQFQMDALIFAPMLRGEQVNGALMIFGATLTEADLAPFLALASQTASALDKARLLAEQRKRAAQLEIVSELAARLNVAGAWLENLQAIVSRIRQEFGYHHVGVFEVDSAQQRIVLLAGAGNLPASSSPPYVQALDVGILGIVARTGEMYLAHDTRVDANHFALADGADSARSELTIPFKQGAVTLGVLDLQSAQPDGFDASDVTAFTILAEQIGSALVKARALAAEHKRAAQLALVSEITAQATALAEPEAMLRQMVELARERFGYPQVRFVKYDAARQEIEPGAVADNQTAPQSNAERFSVAKDLIELAARTGQTVHSGNLHQDTRIQPDRPDLDVNSELCIPFQTAHAVLGVLDVRSAAYHAFDANDIGALETLASQMAVALERAYSLQTERRRGAQWAVVNQIASRITRLVPVPELLRDAAQLIHSQFGYFNVGIFAKEPHASAIRLVANAGALGQLTRPFTLDLRQGIVFQVSATGLTYLCRDTARDTIYHSPFPAGKTDPVKSEIAIPLRRGANVIGILDLQSEQRDAFSDSDVTVLEILADQLATAIENARLFESEARRAAQLEAVRVLALQVTAERDLDALLHSILFSAMELGQADAAALDLVDKTQHDLVVAISHNLQQDYTNRRIRFGEGLAGAAAARREIIIVEDYAQWEGRAEWYTDQDFASMLAIPLQWQNELLGVIVLHRRRGKTSFTQSDLYLAGLFAAQAAIAIENADLVQALHAHLRAQRALAETSARFLDLTAPQTILDESVHGALAALAATAALLFVPAADGDAAWTLASQTGVSPESLDPPALPLQKVLTNALAAAAPIFWQPEPARAPDLPNPRALSSYSSWLVTPLRQGDQAIAVLAVARRAAPPFDTADAQTLALLAHSSGNALERAEAFRQEQQRADELQMLSESFRATASTLDPDQVIRHLLERLASNLDLTSAAFIQLQRPALRLNQTQVYCAPGASPEERYHDDAVWEFVSLAELEKLTADAAAVMQADDPHLSDAVCGYMQVNQLLTVLITALTTPDGTLGYLVLNESRTARVWRQNQILLVQAIASQAATAWNNAALYQAAQTRSLELQALYHASGALNQSLDLQTLCENSVDALRDLLGYAHVSIYFVVGAELVLQVARGYGQPSLPPRIPLTQGVMARALRTRATIFLPDVSTDPDFLLALPHTQAEIAVPLLTADRALGVLNVETAPPEEGASESQNLTAEDVRLLNTFGNQLAIAIENARLFQETRRHLKQVRTLHAASQVLNSDLEWDAALERVASQFLDTLNVDHCALYEWQAADDGLTGLASKDASASAPPAPPLPAHAPFAAQVLRANETVSLARADTTTPDAGQAYLQTRGWRAALLIPLHSKGKTIGLVELGQREREQPFAPDEIELGQLLALQAAIAIENAGLYRDARRRLHETETLYRYTHALGGTLDMETLGARALEAAARLTDFDFGEVLLVRDGDSALTPLAFHGAPPRVKGKQVIPKGVGLCGWVAEHGRAARVDDVTRDPRYVALSDHIMSEICLPLRVGARTIGVLNLEAKAPHAFDARSEQVLTVLGQQLASAIETARLYAQTKRDAEFKALLLRELSHRVKNNLAAITGLLYMALDEPVETRGQILGETLGRVQSMATAHALLARSSDGLVDLLEVGAQTLQDTVQQLAPPGAQVRMETTGDHVLIAMRQLTTLALVLNELATNVLRHGWEKQNAVPLRIHFDVARWGTQAVITLKDNGKGLAPDFDLASCAGVGLSLVQSLVEKDLHGSFTLERQEQWTQAQVKFQVMEQSP